MPGVYPPIEDEDIVYEYLVDYYREGGGKAVLSTTLSRIIQRDTHGGVSEDHVNSILNTLEKKGLISKSKAGYKPLERSAALRRQLEMEEVQPFTREFGETAEAHIDKPWDFRTPLMKPKAGGKFGLGATGHLIQSDRAWRGLTEQERG